MQTHQALQTQYADTIEFVRNILTVETQESPLHYSSLGILRFLNLAARPDVLQQDLMLGVLERVHGAHFLAKNAVHDICLKVEN